MSKQIRADIDSVSEQNIIRPFVNQLVRKSIDSATNYFSVSKWVSATSLALPPPSVCHFLSQPVVSQLIVLNNFSVDKWVPPPYPYPLPSVCPFVSQPVCSIDDSVYQLCCQQMSECCHPTFGPALCFLLSVNQSVSQFIALTNFSVSKWVSAAALPLPFTQCVSFFQSTSLAHVLIY